MNFKSTLFLFGLLLAMLWLFGLTVARQKTAVDASFLLPTLQASPDVVIDAITIQRRVKGKEPETFQFNKDKNNDFWTLQVPGVHKSVKLETFRVDQMAKQIRDARRNDEAGVTSDLAHYGLDQPSLTITLKGSAPDKKEQEWKFYIGRESPDQSLMYVNTSDRPTKVFGITKNSIDSVLFKDPNHLRARRIFEFSDSAARLIDIKDGTTELALKKGDDTIWRVEKPPLGVADFEGPPPPKDLPPGAKPAEGGVKGLLASIATMRVDSEDDFVPISDAKLDTYGLEAGKETMRIEVGTLKDAGAKKDIVNETLAIGKRLPERGQVYARILGDEGVFKLNAKLLEPIKNILHSPGALRSRDLATIDAKRIDALTLTHNKETVSLLHPEGKPWDLQIGSATPRKANSQAIDAFLAAAQGKGEIARFYDGDEFKKLDTEMKNPTVTLRFFEKGLQAESKDNTDTKKETPPALRKDAKPILTLTFAGISSDTVNIERVLADGTTSRFALPRAAYDKIVPDDIALAFLDTALPAIPTDDITGIAIMRNHQTSAIAKSWKDDVPRWYFKEGGESANKSFTDEAKTTLVVNSLTDMSAKRWLHKIDAKEDLAKYGLKEPAVVVTLHVRKDRAATTASLMGLLSTVSEWRGILGGAAVIAERQADPGETIVLKIGNETTDARDKPAHYAQRSDKDMLFLLPADIVRLLRETDLHDRTTVVLTEPLVGVATLGLSIIIGPSALVAASPLATNQVQSLDPAKIKEITLAIRTSQELRNLAFQRERQNNWRDLSGLKEFDLDSQKVTQLVEQLASLKASRWVSLAGGAMAEQKLTARSAALRIEVILENDRTITLTVGAPFEQLGFYAQTSAMPDAVFLLPTTQIAPLMRGPAYFAKDRLASR